MWESTLQFRNICVFWECELTFSEQLLCKATKKISCSTLRLLFIYHFLVACAPGRVAIQEDPPGHLSVAWSNVDLGDYYVAFVKSDDGLEVHCNTSLTQCNFLSECGFTYFISVFAYNKAGQSPLGDVFNYTTGELRLMLVKGVLSSLNSVAEWTTHCTPWLRLFGSHSKSKNGKWISSFTFFPGEFGLSGLNLNKNTRFRSKKKGKIVAIQACSEKLNPPSRSTHCSSLFWMLKGRQTLGLRVHSFSKPRRQRCNGKDASWCREFWSRTPGLES